MTEQPSAEAQALAETIYKWPGYAFLDGRVAEAIDALIAEQVAAETERWQHRDRQRLEQIATLQETVQSFQNARAEHPAPPQRHLTGGEREVLHKALLASSTLVHSGEDLTQDYTERAREIVRKYIELGVKFVVGPNVYAEWMKNDIADALSAVASERDAAAIRAFGSRVWSDTEEVAYQAGVSDTRSRRMLTMTNAQAPSEDQSRHEPWAKDCPSTHCNRRDECCSPNECCSPTRPKGKRAARITEMLK